MGHPIIVDYVGEGVSAVHTDYLDSAALCRHQPCRLLIQQDQTRPVIIYRHAGDDNPEHRLELDAVVLHTASRTGHFLLPVEWLNRVHEYEAHHAHP